ncbi:MAG: LptF/LptG family permease [Pseudomonadota bacterium]
MSTSLDRYLFKQCATPLVFSTLIVTSIVWMTQSLQRIDLLVEDGASVGAFLWLSVLVVPSLLSVIIPFALFGSALYALHRLHSDSEIAVIFAAGIGRWRLAAPLLLITVAGAFATLWVNLDLMPRSYRVLKQKVFEIRADFAKNVLRSGEFITIIEGFTVYVDEVRPGGQLVGLLINDYRDPKSPETYIAERALLRETDAGTVLQMARGTIQRFPEGDEEVSFVRFEETAVNVSSFDQGPGEFQLELTERYLSELLNPDMSREWDRDNAARLIAEGHNRLASPIYSIAYSLLALYALVGGAYNRRGYAMRIAVACAAAGVMRILGFVAQGVEGGAASHALQYAIPIGASIALAIALTTWRRPPKRRRRVRRRVKKLKKVAPSLTVTPKGTAQ